MVYPRVCGGTYDAPNNRYMASGLSPRVRGNHTAGGVDPTRPGSIPACAGEPTTPPVDGRGGKVYPRVCGGTPALWLRVLADSGLSPRVRGNQKVAVSGNTLTRSIPACAGEPEQDRQRGKLSQVYPRVCGGTIDVQDAFVPRTGLSPRVRGNRSGAASGELGSGSIPACAGEPASARRPDCRRRVYPRVCGGTETTSWAAGSTGGLSPRVRGNLCVIMTQFRMNMSKINGPYADLPAMRRISRHTSCASGSARWRGASTTMDSTSHAVAREA